MSLRISFGELAAALKESEWVDDAVLALSKKQHGRPLTPTDEEAMRRAVAFLEEVNIGSSWIQQDQPVIDSTSRRAMASFVKAAGSFGASHSKDRFFDDIELLLETARGINSASVEAKAIDKLRRFFSSLLGSSLQNIDESFATTPFVPPTFV